MEPENKFTFADVPSSELIVFFCISDHAICKVHKHALLQRFPNLRPTIEAIRDDKLTGGIELLFRGNRSAFEALFQYIYTGTYDSPEPILVTPRTDIDRASCSPEPIAKCNTDHQGDRLEAAEPAQKKPCGSCHDILWKSFQAKGLSLKENVHTAEHYSRPNTDPWESYENVFIWHARMFLIANSDYPSLARLAKYKLYQSLTSFQLHDERVIDIVRLLEYCYGHNRLNFEIREIVSHYAAIHVDKLWKRADFVRLVRSNTNFAVDLVDILIDQRLSWRPSVQ